MTHYSATYDKQRVTILRVHPSKQVEIVLPDGRVQLVPAKELSNIRSVELMGPEGGS